MHKITQCPLCKHEEFSHFLTCKDFTVSKEEFNIVSCDKCDFKFTNPVPDASELGKYYKSDDYISHSNTREGLVSKMYHVVRSRTLKRKLDLVARYVSRGTLLDYGCGTGSFLNYAWQNDWKAFGLEPDKGARKIAFESGLNVSADKEVLESKTKDLHFNAITLWHVLEHVSDLHETLAFFRAKLAREGVVVIAVPNYRSADAGHYKEFWAAYDVPRHLYHFDKNSIERLMQQHNFRLIKTYPMPYDSYYVSLLSEKYKTGHTRLIPSFYQGFKSNFRAGSAADYSSVIYVFQK